MSNYNFHPAINSISLSMGLMLLNSFSVSAQKKQSQRPNILVILTDDMGYSDLGCFGSEIRTPNLDRLAATGLRFTQFHNTPRSSPSRASLLTGLYPHQAEMGHLATTQYEEEGYRDDLSKTAVTMAEVFKNAGYATYMTGKWHLAIDKTPTGDRSNWPCQRGFDRYFGALTGGGNYSDPGAMLSNNKFIAPAKNFYYTNAISDSTVQFIREHPANKPFFFYVAYTAAHWPLQAPGNEIAKYKGMYDKGWDSVRVQRFEKLKKLGIIDKNCVLTPRGLKIPEWNNALMKEWQARRMEVYAAMVDIMDQGVGRIISELERKGMLENSIVFYMHDNGACAEDAGSNKHVQPLTEKQQVLKPMNPDSIYLGQRTDYTRDGRFVRSGIGLMPGGADTFTSYGEEWANVSNTPFRLYKHWTHEGGIASPLIVHWPAGIAAKGELRKQPTHLIDIMATCLDITKANYPKQFNGKEIQPYEGKSLKPAFVNKNINREFLIWEHEGNRALRMGKWKLVSKVGRIRKFTSVDEYNWELYDMDLDPTEMNNLASTYPKIVQELSAKWEKEAKRTKAKPWPWESADK
jgi:arylsulfatase